MREIAGIPAIEAGPLAGLSPSYVGQIERGENPRPGLDSLVRLARVFGCTVGWLGAGEGEPPGREAVLRAVLDARLAQPAEPAEVA